MGHLTTKDVKRITRLIENWSESKLTWPLLVEACQKKLGITRTRQALWNVPEIHLAMKNRKVALKTPTQKPGWVKDIHEANERIEKLTATNQKLMGALRDMHARFLIWQANADMHGLTESMLDQPVSQLGKRR